MSAFAAILTLIAAGLSIVALVELSAGDSILKYPYLIIPLSLMLASVTGGLLFVTSIYLLAWAGFLAVFVLVSLAIAIFDMRFKDGLSVPAILWQILVELWHLPTIIRTSRNPPTFQDDLEDTDTPVDEIEMFKDQR